MVEERRRRSAKSSASNLYELARAISGGGAPPNRLHRRTRCCFGRPGCGLALSAASAASLAATWIASSAALGDGRAEPRAEPRDALEARRFGTSGSMTPASEARRGDVMGIADSTASACAAATSASCRMSSASAAAAAAARTSSAAAAVAAAIDLRRSRSAKSSASKWYELARCTLLLLLNIVWSQRSSQDSR